MRGWEKQPGSIGSESKTREDASTLAAQWKYTKDRVGKSHDNMGGRSSRFVRTGRAQPGFVRAASPSEKQAHDVDIVIHYLLIDPS